MKEFRDRVAVVTGAASGIGLAMARRFAAEGMKLVMADVEEDALTAAADGLRAGGAAVLAVPTDVSRGEDVQALADEAVRAFGQAHVVCNNAGVGPPGGPIWERTQADWEWVLGVNLWGVIHGVRVFVPLMLAQGSEGHIVNTASAAGLQSQPWLGVYNVTKHAVVTLSETLHHELALTGSRLRVSVVCPTWVNTRIADSDRNRPSALRNADEADDPRMEAIAQVVRGLLAAGISPDRVAEDVFTAVRDERFYVLPHPEVKQLVRLRMEAILEDRNPTYSPTVQGLG